MKICLILCLATLAISAPLTLEKEWQHWKQQHGKSYSNAVEESMRRAVWFRTYYHIQEHNIAASNSYQLGLNAFADMVRLAFNVGWILIINNTVLLKDTQRILN